MAARRIKYGLFGRQNPYTSLLAAIFIDLKSKKIKFPATLQHHLHLISPTCLVGKLPLYAELGKKTIISITDTIVSFWFGSSIISDLQSRIAQSSVVDYHLPKNRNKERYQKM